MQFIKKLILGNIWFLVILLLAGFIYFYKLSVVPNGLYIDEAYPAYNAYSILKTGKDEYGKFMPIVFRFYGSYNPALYTYLTVVPVALMGLNVFSARFISVICGLGFLVIIYIFFKASRLTQKKVLAIFGLITAAISPWLIFYSRIGYEVTLGLLLLSLGIYFLWTSLKYPRNFIWSVIFFSLSTYAAYAERFIVPMVLVGFVIIFKDRVFSKSYRKYLFGGTLVGLVSQIPNFYILFTPAFFPKVNELATPATHNVIYPLVWIREFFSQYFEYFSPKSLFFQSDPDMQRSIPDISVFYPWMFIPYLFGFYSLWKYRYKDFYKLIFLLLIVTPIPSALTRDPFSTHRALPLVLPIVLVLTLGIVEIFNKLNKRIFWILTLITIFGSALFFWRSYFVLLPNERAFVWQYGYGQLANEIKMRPGSHFVIDQARLKPSYINLAFYLKYPPDSFQRSVDQQIRDSYYIGTAFNGYYNFGAVETRNINWEKDIVKNQILVGDEYTISDSQAKEHHLTKIFEIRDPMLRIVFVGYQTNPHK